MTAQRRERVLRRRARDARQTLLVGVPNAGKSTLFNALTGARQRAVNAPGTTVELNHGRWSTHAGPVDLTDLPGTYSLTATSPDEAVAAQAIANAGPDSVAIVVVDATALSGSLYLLAQVTDAGVRVAVALTKCDIVSRRGGTLTPELLEEALGVPVVEVDGRHRSGLDDLAGALASGASSLGGASAPEETPEARAARLFEWVDGIVASMPTASGPRRTATDAIDSYLLRPAIGVPIFLAVLYGMFELVTLVAQPLMDAATWIVEKPLVEAARDALGAIGGRGTWLEGLLVDGVLVGVATVAAFVPLMAITFVAIAALDTSGYLTRAAVVADAAMRRIGLDGRAVLPMIVGFGCNVPALAATRALPHARHRLVAGLLVPYTACSARLTVFLFIATAFFPGRAGTAVFAMYLLSVALVVFGGLLMRSAQSGTATRAPLVLVLPPYQLPAPRPLLGDALVRVRMFVRRAGAVIVAALVAMWLLTAVPVSTEYGFGEAPPEDSAWGVAAQALVPVMEPAGLDDWRLTSALMTGLAAREAVVGALAQSHGDDGSGAISDLSPLLQETVRESSDGATDAAALAFMVFVLAYTPCVATLAEQRRQLGTARAFTAFGVQLTVAWSLAVAVFQVSRVLI